MLQDRRRAPSSRSPCPTARAQASTDASRWRSGRLSLRSGRHAQELGLPRPGAWAGDDAGVGRPSAAPSLLLCCTRRSSRMSLLPCCTRQSSRARRPAGAEGVGRAPPEMGSGGARAIGGELWGGGRRRGGRLLAGCLRAREVLVQQDGGEDWEVLRGGGGAPDPHPWQRLLRATGRVRHHTPRSLPCPHQRRHRRHGRGARWPRGQLVQEHLDLASASLELAADGLRRCWSARLLPSWARPASATATGRLAGWQRERDKGEKKEEEEITDMWAPHVS